MSYRMISATNDVTTKGIAMRIVELKITFSIPRRACDRLA